MKHNKKYLILILTIIFIILTLVGCSNDKNSSDDFYQVSGNLETQNGVPISDANILGTYVDGTQFSYNDIDKNGNFGLRVKKGKAKLNFKSKKYSFTPDSIKVDKNIKGKKIIGYYDFSTNIAAEFNRAQNEITEIINKKYDPAAPQKSLNTIKNRVKNEVSNITSVITTPKSITVKYKNGGRQTWMTNYPDFEKPANYTLTNSRSQVKDRSLNSSVTPKGNKILFVLGQESSKTDTVVNKLQDQLNSMGYSVEQLSSAKTNVDLFRSLDEYGMVYLQTLNGSFYDDGENKKNFILTGEDFNSWENHYQLFMSGKVNVVALPEDKQANSFSYYWAVTDDFFRGDTFQSNKDTVIFSTGGGLTDGPGEYFIENGAAAFIGWTDNYSNWSANNQNIAPWSIYELIKGMNNQVSLERSYNDLAAQLKKNLNTSLDYIKADDQEIITISTDIDNHPPEMTNIEDKLVDEGNTLSFQINGSDQDGDRLTYSAAGDFNSDTQTFNTDTRSFSWTPTYNDAGEYELTFTVSDGKTAVSETVKITVKDKYKLGSEKWSFNSEYGLFNSPALGDDDTICFFAKNRLYSLNHDGTVKWYKRLGKSNNNNTQASPTVAEDDTIYYGKDKLYALNSAGIIKWTFTPDSTRETPFISRPALSENGDIYIADYYENKLYAISKNGDKKWELNFANHILSEPVVGNDETIYIADTAGNLYAFIPDGTFNKDQRMRWKFETRDEITASPAIANDGTIYIGSTDGSLYALNPDGNKKWEKSFISAIESSPAIGKDGTIYIGANDGRVYALNPDGTIKWKYKTDEKIGFSSPAISQNGTVYIASFDNKLYALNPDGSKKWSFKTKGSIYTSPVLSKDGVVYISSSDSRLYAVHGEHNGLAKTAWPMYGHDPENTGRSRDIDPTNYPPFLDGIPGAEQINNNQYKLTMTENELLQFKLTAGDPDGDELDYQVSGDFEKMKNYSENDDAKVFDADTKIMDWNPSYNAASASPYKLDFKVSDGQAEDKINLTIVIEDVNQPPKFVNLEDQTITEDSTLAFTVDYIDNNNDQVDVTIANKWKDNFDPETNEFSWTTDYDDAGNYDITFTAEDEHGMEARKTITVTVKNNDRPPIIDVSFKTNYSVAEKEELSFTVPGSDPDSKDEVEYSASGLPEGANINKFTGEFTWTPTYEQSRTYTIQITVKSNELSTEEKVEITVNNVNRTPQLEFITDKEITEDEQLHFKITASDDDPGDTITYSASGLPGDATFDEDSGDFAWTPGTEVVSKEEGEKTFTVTFIASDGKNEDKQDVKITVNNKDHPPTLKLLDGANDNNPLDGEYPPVNEEGQTIIINLEADDPDNDPITLGISNKPTGASFNPDTKQFSWRPGYEDAGEYTITFSTTANNKTVEKDITIRVNNTNRAPEFGEITDKTINEGDKLHFSIPVTDPDGDTLTVTAEYELSDYIITSDREFSWVADYNTAGNYTITFIADDGGNEIVTKTVNVTIKDIDRKPEIGISGDTTTIEGSELSFTVNADDPDGDSVNLEVIYPTKVPSGANFDTDTGLFVWTPDFTDAGTYDATFKAEAKGLVKTKQVVITVQNNNRNPEIHVKQNSTELTESDSTITVTEGDKVELDISATDPDSDDNLTIKADSDNYLTQYFNEDTGEFIWQTEAGDANVNAYNITFTAEDDKGSSDNITISIEVNEP